MAYIDRPLDTSPSTTMTIRQGGDLINDNFDELSGTYSTIQQRRIDLFAELQEYGYTSEVDYANGITLNTLDELVYSGGEFWRVSDSDLLPYTTDGTGVPEGGNLILVTNAEIDQAASGVNAVNVAGGVDVTLTKDQVRYASLDFTGELTADIEVVIPDYERLYTVFNNTTGSFQLTLNTALGTGLIIPQTEAKVVRVDSSGVTEVIGSAEVNASEVSYDNSASGLTSNNVQDAVDEVASTIPIGAVQFFQSRDAIGAGYIAHDGQELSRATYPDYYQFFVDAGLIVSEATWQADPTQRGKASDGDGSTTFRVPDFNGKSAGSLGAVYLTGDGHKTAGVAGTIREDEMQRITGSVRTNSFVNVAEGAFSQGESTARPSGSEGGGRALEFDSINSPGARTNTYTHGTDVSGVWCGRAFGAVVNVGSADSAQLASDYANLAGRVSALEAEPGIGWGQTWQDVTASRSTGVTYTNSTGSPIQLSISLSPAGTNRDILIDGQMVARTDSTSNIGNHYMIVPDGSSYEVSGGTISKWWELR